MAVKTVGAVLDDKGRSVIRLPAWASVADASALLCGPPRIGAVVIYDVGRELAGLLTESDLVRGLHQQGPAVAEAPVETLMSHVVPTCRLDDELASVLQTMTTWRFRHVPVRDDQGALVGLISLGDLVQALLRQTELEVAVLRDMVISRS